MIPTRSTRCFLKGEAFTPGSEYYSQVELQDNVHQRKDYCASCWNEVAKKDVHWMGKIPVKKQKNETFDEKALQLFCYLLQNSEFSEDQMYIRANAWLNHLIAEEKELEKRKMISLLILYLSRRGQISKRTIAPKKEHYEILESGELFEFKSVILEPAEGKRIGLQLQHILE